MAEIRKISKEGIGGVLPQSKEEWLDFLFGKDKSSWEQLFGKKQPGTEVPIERMIRENREKEQKEQQGKFDERFGKWPESAPQQGTPMKFMGATGDRDFRDVLGDIGAKINPENWDKAIMTPENIARGRARMEIRAGGGAGAPGQVDQGGQPIVM